MYGVCVVLRAIYVSSLSLASKGTIKWHFIQPPLLYGGARNYRYILSHSLLKCSENNHLFNPLLESFIDKRLFDQNFAFK